MFRCKLVTIVLLYLALCVCVCAGAADLTAPGTEIKRDADDAGAAGGSRADKLISLSSPYRYHVTERMVLTKSSFDPAKVAVVFPLPESNPYQKISDVNVHGGELRDIESSQDKYVRFYLTGDQLLPNPIVVSIEYDVTLYAVTTKWKLIKRLYPYDTGDINYTLYTGASGDVIDPNNATIQSIGDTLWGQSSDLIDYARRCYEYVASHYRYLKPGTGLHPLAEILQDGGGDCGNLSSVFISLLRYKGIPSRHLVAVRPDSSTHVWADFYLEKYGWIPVDVTYKQSDPSSDYFGRVKVESNGIIKNTKTGVVSLFVLDDFTATTNLFQGTFWWYWGSGTGRMYARSSMNSVRTNP